MDDPSTPAAGRLPEQTEPGPQILGTGSQMRADACTHLVVQAARGRGIEPILLKGPSFARWLYSEPWQRTYGDTDLFVAPSDFDALSALLRELGFRPYGQDIPFAQPMHAQTWYGPPGGVDVHHTLLGVGVDGATLWNTLLQHTETMTVLGLEVKILDEPARALHVALHAAQHGIAERKPYEDLTRALQLAEESTWALAGRLAVDLDAIAAFLAGLRLIPAGEELARRLALPEVADIEVILRSGAPPPTAVGLSWLTKTPGLGPKIAYAVRKLFPPRSFMEEQFPIAREGRIGLMRAYVKRVRRIGRELPAGLSALREARREEELRKRSANP